MIRGREVRAPEPPLLELRSLEVRFRARNHVVHAVNDVSFAVDAGRIVGIVGESGCGKSATGLAVLRLLPDEIGWVPKGQVLFQGTDILTLDVEHMRSLRGSKLAMIFQDPMSSLNPVIRIGDQVVEAIRAHENVTRKNARDRTEMLLTHVGIPGAREVMARYPHELSGGMRQRVMIAIAVALKPKLIIADEPTTALDPTIQAQVLALLRRLTQEMGAAMILITHDFGVVAEMADEVIVMYAGRIVEHAAASKLFSSPRHPYTIGLLRSRPSFEKSAEELVSIEGAPPVLSAQVSGCPFAPRCDRRTAICSDITPPLAPAAGSPHGHVVACHNPLPPAAAEAIPPHNGCHGERP